MAESPGSEKRQGAEDERRDPAKESVPRFSEDERRLLAEFFILLDQMDRAQTRDVRKAA